MPDHMVRKIVAQTGAVLIIQWAYHYEITKHWSVHAYPNFVRSTSLRYHFTLVVPDEDPRTRSELITAVNNLCRPPLRLVLDVLRQKQALRALALGDNPFAAIYRIGWPLYNADKKKFPQPGIACKLR